MSECKNVKWNQATIFVYIFFVYLFSRNIIVVHVWRVFIFANAVQKKISRVFKFAKSTKIREICENMYSTLKVNTFPITTRIIGQNVT